MKKLNQIGINAKKAFAKLKNLDTKKINKTLNTYSQLLLKNKKQILKENLKDVKLSKRKHLVDRLILNEKKIHDCHIYPTKITFTTKILILFAQ